MRLVHAKIYGFGKWVDYELDFSKQSFLTIYGKNESGKTTLQRFILFMLFGLPPKQRKFFQPKSSSKMGGRLTIEDPHIGEYTIERLADTRNGAAKCFLQNGEEHGEDWLRERLHGIDEKTFLAIFSFSALDLSKIQDVKKEDLSEVLLGIGLTGSTLIYSAEKRLDQKIGEFFKPYGKNPIINQQLQVLGELRRELTERKTEEATYIEKHETIHNLESEQSKFMEKIKEEKEKKYTLEKIIQALPQIEEYISYQRRLNELPAKIEFPEEGLERLKTLKDKYLPIQSEWQIVTNNKESLLEEKGELETKLRAFPYAEVKKVLEQSTKYLDARKELFQLTEQIQQLEKEIKTELRELNIGLTIEELKQISFPFHTEKDWHHLKDELDQINRDLQQIEENFQLQQSKEQRIDQELREMERSLLPPDKQKELEEVVNSYKENRLIALIQQENAEKKRKWKETKKNTKKRTQFILIGSIIFSVIVALLFAVTENMLFLNLTVLSIMVGLIQWFIGKKSIQNLESMLVQTTDSKYINTHISDTENEKAEQLLTVNQELLREIEVLQDKLREVDIQLGQLQEQRILLDNRKANLNEKIVKQINTYPFLKTVTIHYWPDIYRSLKQLIQQSNHMENLRLKESELVSKMREFEEMVDHFFITNDWKSIPNDMLAKLDFLKEEKDSYDECNIQLARTNKLLDDCSTVLEELNNKRNVLEKEIHTLYTFANVNNEEEFYQKAKEQKEKEEIQSVCAKIRTQLNYLLAEEEWQYFVEQPPKRQTLEIELAEVNDRLEELENELEKNRQQLASVKAEMKQLETSDTYSQLVHSYQVEQDKLANLVKKWAVHKIAKELLVDTKENYRDKYLSKVIDKTAEYFKKITEGAYIKVFPPTDDKPFLVVRKDQIRFSVQELSQGTINQLFVSLRLAISKVMSESMHLPFLIDDAFVHFDLSRMDRMIQVLEEIASEHQILLFTCKQELVDLVNDKNLVLLTNLAPMVEN